MSVKAGRESSSHDSQQCVVKDTEGGGAALFPGRSGLYVDDVLAPTWLKSLFLMTCDIRPCIASIEVLELKRRKGKRVAYTGKQIGKDD